MYSTRLESQEVHSEMVTVVMESCMEISTRVNASKICSRRTDAGLKKLSVDVNGLE